jgi:hypothetical protein
LLGFLFDNYQKQAQINTVIVQQKEVDRVGFEPTTSAMTSSLMSLSGWIKDKGRKSPPSFDIT